MQKRMLSLLCLFLFSAFCLTACQGTSDGATLEGREILLNERDFTNPGENWNILSETDFAEYIISGAVSTAGRSTLAVFEKQSDNTYTLQSCVYETENAVLHNQFYLEQELYDCFWLPNASPAYAEIIYTTADTPPVVLTFDTKENAPICQTIPAQEYSIETVYYDAKGNPYV